MEIEINKIIIGNRYRKELGNIQELADSIKEQGLLQPIGINENNELIFGQRRIEAVKFLGWSKIDCRIVNVTSLIEGERTENEMRKQFTLDERVAIGEAIENKLSNRQGQRTDLNDKLVPTLAQVKGDKTRNIAAQKAGFGGHTTYEKAKVISKKATPEVKEKLNKGDITINKAYQDIKKQEKKEQIENKIDQCTKNANENLKNDKYEIHHNDFSNVQINKSLDLILTDPPYPREFLNEWEKLGQFAKDNLKENGFLVSYSGQLNFPSVISILSKYLDYYWTFALLHNGNHQFITPRNLYCGWKPILIFQKSFKRIENYASDTVNGAGREKKLHKWQQAEFELKNLINYFSLPGETICDPFMGSGTTIAAAIKLNRYAIGIEKDQNSFITAKQRIENNTNGNNELFRKFT